MTVSANRVQFIWSPLLGWALLACSAPAALAQIGVAVPGVTLPGSSSDTSGTAPVDPNAPATGDVPAGAALPSGTQPSAPLPTANAVTLPPIPLPAGTTVQNPSTQVIPGASDVFAGATGGTLSGAGGGGSVASAVLGDELGITVGAFRLYPAIDITVGVDSNVFATSPASAAPVQSLSTIIQPSLALRSEWLNHSINFLLSGGFGSYSSASSQNYQNYFMIVDGRVDIHDNWTATYSLGYRRATEALGTANTSFAQAPTVAQSIPLSLSVQKAFGRLTFEAGASATKSWFTDNSTITSAGLDGASRNRTDYEEHIRLGYEVSDDITLFVGPSITQAKYDQSVDSVGQNRNSSGAALNFGAAWKINATSSIQGSVGYSLTNSAGGLGSTSAYVFGLTGTWNGYQPLTIRPNLSRAITETALSAYRNTINTVLGVDYTYALFDEWALAGGMSYNLADYQPIDGLGATPRQDKFFRFSFGVLWQPRPQLSIGPVYEYTQGSSTDSTSGPSYDRQVFSIRLSAKR